MVEVRWVFCLENPFVTLLASQNFEHGVVAGEGWCVEAQPIVCALAGVVDPFPNVISSANSKSHASSLPRPQVRNVNKYGCTPPHRVRTTRRPTTALVDAVTKPSLPLSVCSRHRRILWLALDGVGTPTVQSAYLCARF